MSQKYKQTSTSHRLRSSAGDAYVRSSVEDDLGRAVTPDQDTGQWLSERYCTSPHISETVRDNVGDYTESRCVRTLPQRRVRYRCVHPPFETLAACMHEGSTCLTAMRVPGHCSYQSKEQHGEGRKPILSGRGCTSTIAPREEAIKSATSCRISKQEQGKLTV